MGIRPRLVTIILLSVMVVTASGCIGAKSGGGKISSTFSKFSMENVSFRVYSQESSICSQIKDTIEDTLKVSNVTCGSLGSSLMASLNDYGIKGKEIVAVLYRGSLKAIISGYSIESSQIELAGDLLREAMKTGGIAVESSGYRKVIKGNSAFYVASILLYRIDPSKLHFYMYGEHTCPHCRAMLTWIPKIYGNGSITFYDLVGNSYNRNLFMELYRLIGVTGVPVIGITYNGTMWAIINSEYNASATPSIVRTAINNDGVLIFTGRWYILYYSDNSSRVLINALYRIFVDHSSVNTTEVLNEANQKK